MLFGEKKIVNSRHKSRCQLSIWHGSTYQHCVAPFAFACTWVTHIGEIFIQLDSSHQYDHFEVQYAYVIIKIKEVMSNPIFLEFYYMFSFKFSMTPV